MHPRLIVTSAPDAFEGLERELAVDRVVVRRQPLLTTHDLIGRGAAPLSAERLAACSSVVCASPRGAQMLVQALAGLVPPPGLHCWVIDSMSEQILIGSGLAADRVEWAGLDAARLVSRIVGSQRGGMVLLIADGPKLADLPSRLADAAISVDVLPLSCEVTVSDVELLAALERADLLLVSSAAVVEELASQGDDACLPAWVVAGRGAVDACRAAHLPMAAFTDETSTAAVAVTVRRALSVLYPTRV